jgi:hypothetical protein
MEAVRSFETFVDLYRTARRYITEYGSRPKIVVAKFIGPIVTLRFGGYGGSRQ